MITEDSISDQPEKKPTQQAFEDFNSDNSGTENSASEKTESDSIPADQSFPKAENFSDIENGDSTVVNSSNDALAEDDIESGNIENSVQQAPEHQANVDTQPSVEMPAVEKVLTEIDPKKTQDGEPHVEIEEHDISAESVDGLTLEETLAKMEAMTNQVEAGAQFRKFNQLKEHANQLIHDDISTQRKSYTESGNAEEEFSYNHPEQAKLSMIISQFREKNDEYIKKQEANQSASLEERQNIIERLKALYTNTEAGTNLFKAIRQIKEDWKNAGQVAKSEFKLLNNNYFHHLNQFYQMLDLNKEYMEQEFAHNLQKREHIIDRAKHLLGEPTVQKALNELQYLHKLWKEEAEPVAEEFREKTWDMFKEISNKIHDRKAELSAQMEVEQNENLEKKNKIIEEIKKLTAPENVISHSYWQNSIQKIENLRSEFLKIGSVPRKVSNQNWNEFKLHLRNFNSAKNEFYKGLKNSQQTNLEEKLKLIQIARDNSLSEDWETTVPLFKKLQEDWKKIGHVPRSMTNKVWEDFREACNTFFNNYREKNNTSNDNWKDNYRQKRQLLDALKEINDEEGSVEKIEALKTRWNSIGKVPREKLSINTEFNKTLREKLKLNKIHDYDLKEEGLSENQLTDKARKIKNQIADTEAEIVKMENNLGFFSNPTRENPLLKETFDKIDEKKQQVENMKQSLHSILAGENQ